VLFKRVHTKFTCNFWISLQVSTIFGSLNCFLLIKTNRNGIKNLSTILGFGLVARSRRRGGPGRGNGHACVGRAHGAVTARLPRKVCARDGAMARSAVAGRRQGSAGEHQDASPRALTEVGDGGLTEETARSVGAERWQRGGVHGWRRRFGDRRGLAQAPAALYTERR
jgi:hypothetical protein